MVFPTLWRARLNLDSKTEAGTSEREKMNLESKNCVVSIHEELQTAIIHGFQAIFYSPHSLGTPETFLYFCFPVNIDFLHFLSCQLPLLLISSFVCSFFLFLHSHPFSSYFHPIFISFFTWKSKGRYLPYVSEYVFLNDKSSLWWRKMVRVCVYVMKASINDTDN